MALTAVNAKSDVSLIFRRLAYLMTMMTTDQMIGKARGHWPWFAGIVVLAAAAAAGLSHRVPSNSRSVRSAPPAIRVTVAPVKTRDVPIYLSAPGTVLAWNTVAVRSQIGNRAREQPDML
jgi:multidrug efflux pump subunit AcrA (membrane-fusion protein)